MRLRRLGLLRFGNFTDRVLDLPASRPDLHLVVGPNEAGKSTIRAAISDLLFGIETRTPFNFVHAYPDMRLAAVLENGSLTTEVQRLKRAKQSLRDADDEPLPDDVLAPYLGETCRDFFERMFGLDHARLLSGGAAILEAKDDVGRVLFEASAGLATLGPVRDSLEEEARSLWTRHAAGNRAYYKAAGALKVADEALKAATVRVTEWRHVEQEREEAAQALSEAVREHEALETERVRLERIRRVGPHLQRLSASRMKQRELAGLEDASDPGLLTHSREIDRLVERRHKVADHPQAIVAARADIDTHAREAAKIAGQLGLDAKEPNCIAETMPSQLVRSEMAELLKGLPAIIETLALTERSLAKSEADLQELALDIERIPSRAVSAGLRIALEAARDLGDTEQHKSGAARRSDEARRQYDGAVARLAPWAGSAEELRRLNVPGVEVTRAAQRREEDARRRLREAQAAVEDLSARIRHAEGEEERLRHARHPISAEEIANARQLRDDRWRRIKGNPESLVSATEDYEVAVRFADDLADGRYARAADAERLELTRETIHELRAKREREDIARLHAARELEEHSSEWRRAITDLAAFEPAPTAFLDWLRAREDALTAAGVMEAADDELAKLSRREVDAVARLRAAVVADGIEVDAPADVALRAFTVLVGDSVARADAVKARLDELIAREAKVSLALDGLRDDAQKQRGKQTEWQQRWTQALRVARLDPETSPAVGNAALEMMARLDGLLAEIGRIERSRVAAMEEDLSSFAADARRLASALAPDVIDRPASDIADELASRLQAAVRRREMRERIAEAIDDTTRDVLEAGDGLSVAELAAELTVEDLTSIASRLSALDVSLREAVARRETCSERRTRAEQAWNAIHGQDDAASAESRRQLALAEMADVAERFVKVFVAARLLRWSIDRYREEKQGPLLRRAGEIFATLTLGSFDRLSVDFEGDTPQLVARRPQGALVGVAGMSDGTRDQLYLALRLAAVELHLAHGRPLPFVADDLFINYDDVRAAAGFKALADLATRTQVIFLTHHEHLVSVAHAAVGDSLDVITL